MKKIVKSFRFIFLAIIFIISGCGTQVEEKVDYDTKNIKSKDELSKFYFNTILVYCPVSMERAVMEIKDIFENETGCEVQVNVAEEKDLIDEVKTKKGEVILLGDSDNKKDIARYIDSEKNIVGHIPVFAVKKGDFSGINTLDGLINNHASYITTDFSSSLGQISQEFLKMYLEEYEYNYFDDVKESELYSYLDDYDGYTAIVWKESIDNDKVDFIELDELNGFYKLIKASRLKSANNKDAVNEFIAFLLSDDSKQIWGKYGYILI